MLIPEKYFRHVNRLHGGYEGAQEETTMQTLLALVTLAIAAPVSAQTVASLAGTYDGHQTEMGAGLRLKEDGRFEYGLVYGALDEAGQGRWVVKDGRVLLTSDPVTPPRFAFTGQKPGSAGILRIALETPRGISPQYFDAVVTFARGETRGGQLTEEGLSLPFESADPPVSVRMFLPMFDVKGDVVPIDAAKGYALAFRFEPNDIGKADFRDTALTIDKTDLLLERFDRTIRFKRVE